MINIPESRQGLPELGQKFRGSVAELVASDKPDASATLQTARVVMIDDIKRAFPTSRFSGRQAEVIAEELVDHMICEVRQGVGLPQPRPM